MNSLTTVFSSTSPSAINVNHISVNISNSLLIYTYDIFSLQLIIGFVSMYLWVVKLFIDYFSWVVFSFCF